MKPNLKQSLYSFRKSNDYRINSFVSLFRVLSILLIIVAAGMAITGIITVNDILGVGGIASLALIAPAGIVTDPNYEKEKLLADSINNELQKYKSDIEAKINLTDKDNKEQIKSLSEILTKVESAIKAHGELLQSYSESKKSYQKVDMKKAITEAVEQLNKQRAGFVQIKSGPTTMLESTHLTGQIPQAERESGYNNLIRQVFELRAMSNVFGISSNTAEWVEQFNLLGAAATQVEGQPKAIIDWEYRVNSAAVQTIAEFVKISKQMLSDVEYIESEIDNNLVYQIALKEEAQLLTGNGIAPNINGVTKYAQTVDLSTLAGTIPFANYLDAIGAAITQIYVIGKGTFIPNVVYINPATLYILQHGSKTTEGEYLLPAFMMPDKRQISGVVLKPSVTIPAGYILAADMLKFTIRDREGVVIEMGWENDDFTRNLVTIRAEKRLVSYVKENDVEAFVYDNLDTIAAYINKTS